MLGIDEVERVGLSGSGNDYTLILDEDGGGLTAIPEPSATLLLLLGGSGVFIIRRKFQS